jgi:hypothetical protein
MIQRCCNPVHPRFADWGGRGITICERYRNFENFFADLGPRPAGLSLDRKDNDGGYWCGKCPECLANGWPMNVRWATPEQQRANRRS